MILLQPALKYSLQRVVQKLEHTCDRPWEFWKLMEGGFESYWVLVTAISITTFKLLVVFMWCQKHYTHFMVKHCWNRYRKGAWNYLNILPGRLAALYNTSDMLCQLSAYVRYRKCNEWKWNDLLYFTPPFNVLVTVW